MAGVSLVAGLFLASGTVLAVHDENFQLDGDTAATTTTTVPASGPGSHTQTVDWDSIFDSTGADKNPLPANFKDTGFQADFKIGGTPAAPTFITSDDSTYATGSKDTLPISGWQCNQDNNVNSKIDVMNAYVVTYTNAGGDKIQYFSLERNTNTGTADVGFWFLQDAVGCTSPGGAVTFTGAHLDGDVLVVSEFSNGGTVSTINVYRWDRNNGNADCNLDPIGPACVVNQPGNPGSLRATPIGAGVDCRNPITPPGDPACAVSNTTANGTNGTITVPWQTANFKDGVGNKLRTSEFFEGGINLTDLKLGGKCFSSFIGDTRSSTSLTATLFDFAGGTSGSCGSGIETTPQAGGGGAIPATIGTSARVDVRDHAVITVNGTSGAFAGTVKFFLCGPLAANTTENCSTGGVQIGSPATGETVSGAAGTANLNSDTATLTSAGRYCWRAEYSGDSTVGIPASKDPSKSVATGGTTSECFTIAPVQPILTTAASDDVTLGTSITDTASLTGTAKQPGTGGLGGAETIAPGSINALVASQANAGGSITFTVKGPNNCTASGLTVTPASVTVSGDNVSYGPVSATPTAVGKYTFVAQYINPTTNTLAAGPSSCPPSATDGDEEVTVANSSIETTPQAGGGGAIPATIGTSARVDVRDHAVISVTGTQAAFAGTVKFFLCGPLAANTTENCSTGGVQIGSPATGETVSGAAGTANLNSDTATLTSAGRYCWRAEYSGDTSVHIPASKDPAKSVADGGTTSECFTIAPVQPILTTQASADVTLSNPITDTASLTGTAKQPGTGGLGGAETIAPGSINALVASQANAGGSITFTVKGPNNCTASGLTVTPASVTVSGDNVSYGPVSATPTALGKYTFVAQYINPTTNTLAAGPSSCPPSATDGDEEVTVTGSATLATAQRWLPNDSAEITGPTGTTLSGNVVFKLFNDATCGQGTGTQQYTQTIDVTTGTGAANDKVVSTNNTSILVTVLNDGTAWSWLVSYDDANLADPANRCETTTPAFTLSD